MDELSRAGRRRLGRPGYVGRENRAVGPYCRFLSPLGALSEPEPRSDSVFLRLAKDDYRLGGPFARCARAGAREGGGTRSAGTNNRALDGRAGGPGDAGRCGRSEAVEANVREPG